MPPPPPARSGSSSRPSGRGSGPRSLADDLRGRDDAALVALLRSRPDLAAPVPADTGNLAVRASTRHSVQRAVDARSRPELDVLAAVVVLAARGAGATRTPDVAAACGLPQTRTRDVLGRQRELGLLWGTTVEHHPVGVLADALGPHPAGLGPSLADLLDSSPPVRARAEALGRLMEVPSAEGVTGTTARLAEPAALDALLADAPEGTRGLLERLDADGPLGQVSRARRDVDVAREVGDVAPLDWLLARALLVPVGDSRVVLPREVGLALREGRVHARPVALAPPPVPTRAVPAARRDGLASGAAAEAVRLVDRLGRVWGARPAPVLRAGGLGVRELGRVAAELEVDAPTAALVVELAAATGLVAQDGEADPAWAPTPRYDDWADGSTGERWAALASAWLQVPRLPSLVGDRDDRGSAVAALSDALVRPQAPVVRALLLDAVAEVPDGEGAGPDDLAARLAWRRPRWAPARDARLLATLLEEASWLGLLASGSLAGAARALVGDAGGVAVPDEEEDGARRRAAAAAVLDAALPAPVSEVLLQADLTAVAPGPLERDVEVELELAADVESRGGATVYRFDGGTVRRALDAGRTADDVLAFLGRVSPTPVPQPLEYLVRDVARRHGRVRVGSAGAYLRSDDEAALAELLAERRTAGLGLRRLAPTVLVATADPSEVLRVVRSLGLAPAAESADGSLVLDRPVVRRTPPRRPPRPSPGQTPPGVEVAASLVAALRAGDEAVASAPPPPAGAPLVPPADPAVSLSELRRAATDRRPLWVGYVDTAGGPSRVHALPLGVEGGRISVRDLTSGAERTLSVHRVTGTAPG
ncbi:helicase-associated domain-containing protein [Pseudokineococcus basanitobsidens]|uniref:Helicase-associated domain-containing protein n=1 Tax=Pseudokineococcus basanitobsidens TaxID=1926649 RepID=A0ABU8RMB1_9ACTN